MQRPWKMQGQGDLEKLCVPRGNGVTLPAPIQIQLSVLVPFLGGASFLLTPKFFRFMQVLPSPQSQLKLSQTCMNIK